MNINLNIERLVLEGVGVAPGDEAILRAAAEAELSRLLTSGGLSPALSAGGDAARVPGGEVRLAEGGEARQLGVQVARAVYEGVRR